MVYAEPYVYLRAIGVFGATAAANLEQWGVGLKFRNPGTAPSAAQLQTFADQARTRFTTYHTGSGTAAGAYCWLTEITTAYVGTDGKYVGGGAQPTTRAPLGTPVQGQGTPGAPFTQALVVSLRTILTRGRGSNGRMYYPALGMTTSSGTGVVSSAAVASAAAAAQVLINGLNTDADATLPGTGGVSVMSNVGAGVAATVTAIRVGNKLDHQESRERKILETYTQLSITGVTAFTPPPRDVPIA